MPVWAQNPGTSLNAYAYDNLTVTNASVVSLIASNVTPTDPTQSRTFARARLVLITIDGAAIRFRVDGGNPATAGGSGHLADATTPLILTDYNQMLNFKAIADTATTATLRVTYFR